ncbi:AAA family ATPase [Flexivirga oryzae]|uniref:DNA-binding SARP family transcriptional activator/tetratricopeptide (TPR) repeat protein n=1 Tax=Flexivirga oryzae TaxID=1794944 RepID=A0A839N933_9MICO|nr:DNA-binding SARP family transcriptional activator/tetratricopeptide (TPR) repeat protein [Flexivirga oryzae]
MVVGVAVCGELTVQTPDQHFAGPRLGTPKARLLLAALALTHHQPVSTDRLAEIVWEDRPPQDPAANLATLASRLRRTLDPAVITPGLSSYTLGRSVEVDVDTAAELLLLAEGRFAAGEPTLALAGAARALDLLGDGSLADECVGPWADAPRREAEELCRRARHLHAACAAAVGATDDGLPSARAATLADPYDERAHRDLVRLLVAAGRSAEALDELRRLTTRLTTELGSDPDDETRRLQLAVLQGGTHDEPAAPARPAPPTRPALVGRRAELDRIDAAWTSAQTGATRLVLVSGVPGIGKTRLLTAALDTAAAGGGLTLTGRCRPSERSLFLQPFAEVLRPVLLSQPPGRLRNLLGAHLPAWARLLPELAELFELGAIDAPSPELIRRQAFDAVAGVLSSLSVQQPVLLALDDLQYGARATAGLLVHLADRLGAARVLLLGAARTDGPAALPPLPPAAEHLTLGPLAADDVDELVRVSGQAPRAEEIRTRTRGHPLSVVAVLRALASGSDGTPEDLTAAVRAQLRPLDPTVARAATAASVLGTLVEPPLLAALLGRAEADVVESCEQLVAAGLFVPTGARYEFVNDLVQEAVARTLPEPLAVAHHRRAIGLLSARPERMAHHAHEAGEPQRAAAGYLQAGRTARRNGAVADAVALLTAALTDATHAGDDALVANVLLERARAHEARPDFAAAEDDLAAAAPVITATGDARLQMRAEFLLGGDISVARHRTLEAVLQHNRTGLLRAAELGDPVAVTLFRSRMVVLECSRLRLDDALTLARRGVAETRSGGTRETLARSLDGLKTVHAYCADAESLAPVITELLPLLGGLRVPWLRQWALLESALVPAAAGDWAGARARVDEALAVNRETGYAAYTGFFLAQRSWLARLAGDLDAALTDARRAVLETADPSHPWWYATAVGCCASALLELGRPDEAAELCATGLEALGDEVGSAYRLRCLAPYAAATGERIEETDRLVAAIRAPAGQAWVPGADVYDALARAWVACGEPHRAAGVVAPLLAATAHSWRSIHERVAQRIPATSRAARSAPSAGTGR